MKKVPASVTMEEAVAYMVNMDYIPEGFTLLEMLEAFSEEAEVEYENDPTNLMLKTRKDSCNSRYILAERLLESLQYEVDHPEDSLIVLADETSSKQRLTFESVADWAAEKYGIGITVRPFDKKLENVRWEDVTIKIWENHKIGYKIKSGNFTNKLLKEVGLMGKNKYTPNQLNDILSSLSVGKPFGQVKHPENKQRVVIVKLRNALKRLVDLRDDPFRPQNPDDGWKPRFKLRSYITDSEEYIQKFKKN